MTRAGALPEHRASMPQVLAWTALLVVILSLYARGVGSFQVGVYQDDAGYLVLSRSFAFGDHYGLVNGPGPTRPSKYPFMFPLLLSPFADSLVAAKRQVGANADAPEQRLLKATAVPLLATLINVSLLFWAWPLLSRTSRWWGLGIAYLHGLSPLVTAHARMIMSEPVFLTFVLAVLLLTETCADGRSRPGCAVALGAAIAAAVFTRTIGITVAVAAVVRLAAFPFQLSRRQPYAASARDAARTLALLALGAVALVGSAVASTSMCVRDLGSTAYADELLARTSDVTGTAPGAFAAQVARVGRGYLLDQVRNVILPVGGGERTREWAQRLGVDGVSTWIGAAVLGAVLIGAWQSASCRLLAPTVLLFEVIYFAAIVLWPWDQTRYLYPLQPFLQFQFLVGAAYIAAIGTPQRFASQRPLGAGTAAVVGLVLVFCSGSKSFEVRDSRQFTRDLSIGTDWLARHTPPGAIVMARYPEAVYLYSGRATVDLITTGTPADVERLLAGSPADYVLVAPSLIWGAVPPALSSHEQAILAALADMASHGRAELVYESARDRVVIYALRASRLREGS